MVASRRTFLKLTALGAAAALLPLAPTVATFSATPAAPSPRVTQFVLPLKLPPELRPTRVTETTDFYEVTQKEARVEILPGLETTIWGYEGMFPGPTFRARSGREVVVNQTNLLSEGTAVHLHGGVTAPDSDGYPTDLIAPADRRAYVYSNEHPAATLWYHDHAMDRTGLHNYMGLAGFYLVEDDVEDRLPLPKGAFDVPLLLQDRRFAADGSLVFRPLGDVGMIDGDVLLVNGVPWPRFAVANRRYRFRILNGSNSTIFNVALDSGHPFAMIGTEGGLLPAPVQVPEVRVAMAERVEVVIDFAAYPIGTHVVLENRDGAGRMGQIMRFDVVRHEPDDSSVPATLRPFEALTEAMAVQTREWVFGPRPTLTANPPVEWVINGREFDPNRIDATPVLGTVEIWRVVNQTLGFGAGGMDHPVHVHLVNFLLLDRNGAKPAPYEAGWKDTVLIPKGEEVRLIMRFAGHRGKYIMHCHNLEHEDSAMMTSFLVV
jgi:FtsP/CotA-like multicopper oxidase with cupredoxin domain